MLTPRLAQSTTRSPLGTRPRRWINWRRSVINGNSFDGASQLRCSSAAGFTACSLAPSRPPP